MERRLELQALLETFAQNVYFQPPPEHQMEYPAIRYQRDDIDNEFAGNKPYRQTKRYQVIVIDPDPDSEIVDAIAKLPMCRFSRHWETEGLNHDAFNLYF